LIRSDIGAYRAPVVENDRSPILKTILLAAAVVVLAAGVAWLWAKVTEADDNAKSEASPTTTSTAPVDAEAEIEDAYRAYMAMQQRLLQAPDPSDPELPQRATGSTLDRLRATLADYAAKGQVIRVGPATAQTILSIEVSGDQATVRACYVDESGLYEAASGAELQAMHTGTAIDRSVLQRDDGIWRVSRRFAPAESEHWEGATTCGR
jgi:hypothetical protein